MTSALYNSSIRKVISDKYQECLREEHDLVQNIDKLRGLLESEEGCMMPWRKHQETQIELGDLKEHHMMLEIKRSVLKDIETLCLGIADDTAKQKQELQHKVDKVYIVTSGEYSDYHIETVCLNREDAERYVCLHQGVDPEEMRIEEHPICNGKELANIKINRGVSFYMRDSIGITSYGTIYSGRPVRTSVEYYRNYDEKIYHGIVSLPDRFSIDDQESIEKLIYDAVAKFKAEEAML